MSHSHTVKNSHRGSRQTHKNTDKFNPYRYKDENDRVHESYLARMTTLCCKRCCDILQWKVDYGKYEPQERPRKCNLCNEKSNVIAYHRICQKCAFDHITCAKCQKRPSASRDGDEVSGGSSDPSDAEEVEKVAPAAAQSTPAPKEEGEAPIKAPTWVATKGRRGDPVYQHVLSRYEFVNVLDDDEAFHPFVGLDIRRFKAHQKAIKALAEKDELGQLRERERRTRLRKERREKKANGELDEGSDMSEEDERI